MASNTDGSGAAPTISATPAPVASPPAPVSINTDATSSPPVAIDWFDITSRLKQSVSSLRPGELLHHSSFSLKESMSALEVGDPKMDATMHVPTNVVS